MNYHILTGEKKKKILVTENYNEMFDFIVKNKDTKIRTIDHTGKPKIFEKRSFLVQFFKNTNDKVKLFCLTRFIITGYTNQYDFLKMQGLSDEYKV